PQPGLALPGGRRGGVRDRFRPAVPGCALAQRRGRRRAVGDRLAAGAGPGLPQPRGALVLDAAAGDRVLRRLPGGSGLAPAAGGRPAAGAVRGAGTAGDPRPRRLVGRRRLARAAGAPQRARREPALAARRAGRGAAAATARAPRAIWLART